MQNKKVYTIDTTCVGCGSCKTICPTYAISKGVPHTINEKKCIGCGKCVTRCWRKIIYKKLID